MKAGENRRAEDFLEGAFRRRLEAMGRAQRERALDWLGGFNIPAQDLPALRLDDDGGVFYACEFPVAQGIAPAESASTPAVAEAAVPVSPFPASLIFHSRPGAPNVIFLDFDGATVTGTAWNSSNGVTTYNAVAFSDDGDFANYSDGEQAKIKQIWMRVAEDYAPFDVDVTTEAPAVFNNRTCQVLITRNTDANGTANPSSGSGGVAYINVFGSSSYSSYRPAWVYGNNLGPYNEGLVAEAASHEAGHNMGLSHDGTSTTTYYGGHGSGDTSWGPIMGTGYNRNVSQWSKGEYYDANNTEDDLAIIAGKLSYRADDAGNTSGSPKALTITNFTTLLVTTVNADPANASPANKGVLERNTDVDVWSFNSGAGALNIRVDPFVSPANTRGGNADLLVELYNSTGGLVGSYNPSANTYAVVNPTVPAGLYYLHIKNTGTGTPTASSPSGYTAYGSIGQYFISGTIPNNSGIVVPPQAASTPGNLTSVGVASHPFTVTYSDDVAVDVSSLDGSDIRITGPNGYTRLASFVSVDNTANGTPRVATYGAPAPDGSAWTAADNGTYQVELLASQVRDTESAYAAAKVLGSFEAQVPVVLYAADMTVNPGWSFTGPASNGWAWGDPTGSSGDPNNGYTGVHVIGYNLNGSYAKNLPTAYATTPSFNCSTAGAVTLQFRRWLGLRSGDTASIQASSNGTTWTTLWTTTSSYNENAWQLVTLDLSAVAAGQPAVQLRWGLASNGDNNVRCGWNLDDVFVLGGGVPPDVIPPSASAAANDITIAGNPFHAITATYLDNQAVSVASLDGADITVSGPSGFSAAASFDGVNESSDGTPRVASYSIGAPGGTWDASDNGVYTISLEADQVFDPSGNDAPAGVLGTFSVNIPTYTLTTAVTPPGAGTVTPTSGVYTAGASISVTATANANHRFSHWSGDNTSTNSTISLVMTKNMSLTAHFLETVPPSAALSVSNLTQVALSHPLVVTYSDNVAISVASLDGQDLRVTGPDGYDQLAALVSVDDPQDGTPRVATYSLAGPGGEWDPSENGTYTVSLQAGQVADTAGNTVPAGVLGTFTVNIPTYTLTVLAQPTPAGSVDPAAGVYPAGRVVSVTADPSLYYEFTGWSGAVVSTNLSVEVTLWTNLVLTAEFEEILTVNHPTPLVWLAAHGVTNNFETAVDSPGANGMAYWESYIAGLDPLDPEDDFRLDLPNLDATGEHPVLSWETVEGRLYSLSFAHTPAGPFLPLADATNLPWTVQTVTDTAHDAEERVLYRLEVRLP